MLLLDFLVRMLETHLVMLSQKKPKTLDLNLWINQHKPCFERLFRLGDHRHKICQQYLVSVKPKRCRFSFRVFVRWYSFRSNAYFHLHALGETTPEMGKANPPLAVTQRIDFGFYACSPSDSSFEAKFSEFTFEECQWRAHE